VCPTCYNKNTTQLGELPFDYVRTNAHRPIGMEQQNRDEIMCSEHPMIVADIYCETPNCEELIFVPLV